MRATVAILIILGLVAAIAASILVASLRGQQQQVVQVQPETVEVDTVVALQEIEAGTIITPEMVEERKVVRENAPASAITGTANVIGKVLLRPVIAEETFTRQHFPRAGWTGLELAGYLPEGKRAMSVTLSESASLEGLLYPGSKVDVIASFQTTEEEEELIGRREVLSTVLLENIRVLGANDRTVVTTEVDEEGQEARRTARRQQVTLEVNSKQAEALALASAHGTISLAMRKPTDDTLIVSEFEREDPEGKGTLFSDLAWWYSDRLAQRMAERQAALEGQPAQAELAALTEDDSVEPAEMPVRRGARPIAGGEAEAPKWSVDVIRGDKRNLEEGEIKTQIKEGERRDPRQTAGSR